MDPSLPLRATYLPIADDAAAMPDTEAHRRVRGASPTLAQDALRSREANDAVHRQEVGRVPQPIDEVQLVPDLSRNLVRQPFGIAVLCSPPCELFQGVLRRQARLHDLGRVLVFEFGEREGAALGNFGGSGDGVRVALEEARHLGRGLQEPIGETLAPEAGVIDGAALTNAGHDVLEHPALRRVIEHVVRRDGRHASRTGCFLKPVEPKSVVWPEAPVRAK